jgi:hypothetical protein
MSSLVLPQSLIALQIPLLYLNNILGLAIGPTNQILRIGLTLPILIFLASQSLYREWSGEWGMHYALNCMVLTAIFTYVDWNLLSRPDTERWRKIQYKGEKPMSEVPIGFWERAWWAARLCTGNRYVGWTSQVKNVPVEVDAEYPRWYVYILSLSSRVRLILFQGSLSCASLFALLYSISSGMLYMPTLPLPHMVRGPTLRKLSPCLA